MLLIYIIISDALLA